MGIIDFAAGYALGGKAGNQGIDEFIAAGREVIHSREFQALVGAARNHAATTFRHARLRAASLRTWTKTATSSGSQ